MPNCPDCGAVLDKGEDCQSIFESFLALEYTRPDFDAVHFLTVTCFMIQHKRYSDDALHWIESKLHTFIERGSLDLLDRRQMAKAADDYHRHWKVTRQPSERELPEIAWSVTVADVARRYRDAVSYCALVEEWARATLAEMQPWLIADKSARG